MFSNSFKDFVRIDKILVKRPVRDMYNVCDMYKCMCPDRKFHDPPSDWKKISMTLPK